MPTTPCDCSQAGFCRRHNCDKTPHWYRLCRNRPDYFRLWERGLGPGQRAGARSQLTGAVVVLSHNYGRFLPEALASVVEQLHRPSEILVVDDASRDDTPAVAAAWFSRGVKYMRIEERNVHQARRAGLEATTTDVLCFLDADDRLAPDYLARGLAEFQDERVAVVYSDVEQFDARTGRSRYPAVYEPHRLQRDNYIHAGSLVRRDALLLSGAFEQRIDPLQTQGDWFLWRRVLTGRWTARKQPAIYFYRQHGENWMRAMHRNGATANYFAYAGLEHEDVTLFVPLSGREQFWPRLKAFLERQTWPHDQIRLVLFDTSRTPAFSHSVRSWLAGSDYADVRHIVASVAQTGLADEERRDPDVRERVVLAMQRIYARMAELAETEYVWIVEDDVLPPDDACQRLLRGFDATTASVAAPYLSRYRPDYVVWNGAGVPYAELGDGLQEVGGNGFGCTIIRRSALAETAFMRDGDVDDFDRAFYRRIQRGELSAKVDWSITCEHGVCAGSII